MFEYTFTREDIEATYAELEPLYRAHYKEMQDRLHGQGLPCSDYNPDLGRYFAYGKSGFLSHFVARSETGEAVGYCNVYVTNDMHNGDLIAQEDTIFIRKDHRNGVGRKFVKAILEALKEMGVRRANVTAMTDLRVAKLWERMGFRHTASAMTYFFEG